MVLWCLNEAALEHQQKYLTLILFSLQKLFDEKWHQLRLLVTEEEVTMYVDDLGIETLALEPPVGIFINGKTQVGKYVSKETTVPVSTLMTSCTVKKLTKLKMITSKFLRTNVA